VTPVAGSPGAMRSIRASEPFRSSANARPEAVPEMRYGASPPRTSKRTCSFEDADPSAKWLAPELEPSSCTAAVTWPVPEASIATVPSVPSRAETWKTAPAVASAEPTEALRDAGAGAGASSKVKPPSPGSMSKRSSLEAAGPPTMAIDCASV
jgi:hypothetical protein